MTQASASGRPSSTTWRCSATWRPSWTSGFPSSIGASRKRFIGSITGVEEATERVFGTVATTVLAYEKGATLFRVHDVRANREALAVAEAVLGP